MDTWRKIFFVILIFQFIGWGTQHVYAQDQFDLESWNRISLKKNLSKRWKLNFDNHVRFDEGLTSFSRYIGEFGVSYDLMRRYQISYGLRYILKNDNNGAKQGFRSFVRFNWDLNYKYKVERFKFSYRYRFQRQHELGKSEVDGDFASIDHRIRLKVGYNIQSWKWDPFLSLEGFYHLQTAVYSGIDKYRAVIGDRT